MEIEKFDILKQVPTVSSAIKSEMVRNVETVKLKTVIAQAMAKAFQDCGQVTNDSDAAYLLTEMMREVLENFSNIRIDEISVAIKKGIRKEFGEYYGLNVLTFSMFLKSYLESEERKAEAKRLANSALPEKAVPTKEELRKMENEVIVNAYNKFCEHGHYDDHGNHIYHKLDERGLIPFNRDRKLQIFEQAKEKLKAKYNPATALDLQEKRTFQKETEVLLSGSKDASATIATEAKKIALMTLFQELKEVDVNIHDFIIETEEKF